MNDLILRIADGTRIVVPAGLDSITTYVLLEQEDWFEKEVGFVRRWLKPGMGVIDIGANLGLYALTMARLVGPGGTVHAFEPGSDVRRRLERSRDLNGLSNLTIVPAALSDSERTGVLEANGSSELNALSGDDRPAREGESVRVSTLDGQAAEQGWPAPDFVKIDAEGEEERIIAGGRSFFTDASPLVMFEVKAGIEYNLRLPGLFTALGYGIYRLLPGGPMLVPHRAGQPLDGFELNLFAAKPDRAASLEAEGLLAASVPPWSPGADDLPLGRALLREQAFAAAFAPLLDDSYPLQPEMAAILAGYAVWRDGTRPAQVRCGALVFALSQLAQQVAQSPTLPRLCLFARLAAEAGERVAALSALGSAMTALLQSFSLSLAEPFWPPTARFDGIDPGADVATWMAVAIAEGLEGLSGFSSLFAPGATDLDWLCSLPFARAEMERRRVLSALRAGRPVSVPDRLRQPAPDHLNAEVWASGVIERMPR